MADPISIGSTILGLLSVGAAIFNGLKNIQEAPSAIRNVKNDIASLSGVLLSLEKLLESDDSLISVFPPYLQEALSRTLKNLMDVQLQLFETLRSYMDQAAERWLFVVVRQVKWAFVKERDVEKLRRHLESHKGTLGMTMMVLQSFATGRLLQGQEDVKHAMQAMGTDLKCNADTQSTITNQRLYGTKEPPNRLPAKDIPDTGHNELNELQNRGYLGCLENFVVSGGYEGSLARVQYPIEGRW